MTDQTVLDRIAATNRIPAGTDVPPDALTADVARARIERRMGMDTLTRETTTETARRPRRLVAVATFAAIIAVVAIGFALFSTGGDDVVVPAPETTVTTVADDGVVDTSADLSPSALAAARSGDRIAAAQVYFWAYWTGDTDLIREFTSDANPLRSDDFWVDATEFIAVSNGDLEYVVTGCEAMIGVENRYSCSVEAVSGSHELYESGPGLNVAVSFNDADEVTALIATGLHPSTNWFVAVAYVESLDPERFAEVCENDAYNDRDCGELFAEAYGAGG